MKKLIFREWFSFLIESAHGCLLAATAYLFLCVGSGIIPWKVLEYFISIGMMGVCISATSLTKEMRWSWPSLIPLIILSPICFLFLLGLAGLPGNEFTTRGLAAGFALFPLAAAIIHVARRPSSAKNVSKAFMIAGLAGALGLHMYSKNEIQKEIAATLSKGGCVLSTGSYDTGEPKLIQSVRDVRIGIVRQGSDRIYFINGSEVSSWSYSAMKPIVRKYFDQRLKPACGLKDGAAN
jgi:hypothetical protein